MQSQDQKYSLAKQDRCVAYYQIVHSLPSSWKLHFFFSFLTSINFLLSIGSVEQCLPVSSSHISLPKHPQPSWAGNGSPTNWDSHGDSLSCKPTGQQVLGTPSCPQTHTCPVSQPGCPDLESNPRGEVILSSEKGKQDGHSSILRKKH